MATIDTIDMLHQSATAPTGTPRQPGTWTVADWSRLPDDGTRYEIIGGVLFMTTSPSFFHQWVIKNLVVHVGAVVESRKRGVCAVAPIGLIQPPSTVVQPDFLVVLNDNLDIIRNGRLWGAPDLVAEVLSPGNSAAEQTRKRELYEHIGVPEYLVLDPSNRTLTRYRRDTSGHYGEGQVFRDGDSVTLACLPDVTLAVADLFSGSPDTTVVVSEM